MSLAAQEQNSTTCTTAQLLVEFELGNRSKAQDNLELAPAYAYAATQFRKALHLHIAECAACLALEDAEEGGAA